MRLFVCGLTKVVALSHCSTGAQRLARQAGLPDYQCSVVVRKKSDRAKLDGKACPECEAVSDHLYSKHNYITFTEALTLVYGLGLLCEC